MSGARWLVFDYEPTALFSLKSSRATSTVGKTLVVPTPYACKMALVDAGLRTTVLDEGGAGRLIGSLAKIGVRIGVPEAALVTHSMVKVRQEPKNPTAEQPYLAAVAYREFVYWSGTVSVAFDVSGLDEAATEAVRELAPLVNYWGKRGGFVQFVKCWETEVLGVRFTQPWAAAVEHLPDRAHVAMLDDFGPEASLAVLSSYSDKKAKRDRHRKFVSTLVPLGVANRGAGFTLYRRASGMDSMACEHRNRST